MLTFEELKTEAVQRFGDFGEWVFDQWKTLNDAFFGGENRAGAIRWETTPQDRSLGYYFRTENYIVLHKNLMRPIYPTDGLKREVRRINKKLVRDVLLHEMIHQRVHQTGGWLGENSHNNDRFVEEVNRIAKLLGMNIRAKVIPSKIVQGKTVKIVEPGCLTLEELSNFPYLTRSRNYYYEPLS